MSFAFVLLCIVGRAAPEAPAPVKPAAAAKSKGKAAGKADAERASSSSGAAADDDAGEAAAAGAEGAEAAAAASGGGNKGKKKGKKGAATAASPEEEKPVDEEALQVCAGVGILGGLAEGLNVCKRHCVALTDQKPIDEEALQAGRQSGIRDPSDGTTQLCWRLSSSGRSGEGSGWGVECCHSLLLKGWRTDDTCSNTAVSTLFV
jgi:hypothetical protein